MNLPIENIYSKIKERELDAALISLPANITYLTGYASRDSYFLISKKGNIYFTDSRYTQEAKKHLKNISRIESIDQGAFKAIARSCRSLKLKTVGFEEKHTSYAEFRQITKELKSGIKLLPLQGLVETAREIKTPQEIAKIKTATKITIRALQFINEFIKPGIREIEVAAELERFTRYEGAHGSAFSIIVASGPNSSYPHHITSRKKIRKHEHVLIDIGTDYQGYKSDLTRIFFLGKINVLARKIYDIVLGANELAIKAVKPGVPIKDIDAIARNHIAKSGYGEFFGHALGHGIGLMVHEAPSVSAKQEIRLEPGMIFTIEPAIYLPQRFGIRIEDMILVTRKGYEVLSGSLNK